MTASFRVRTRWWMSLLKISDSSIRINPRSLYSMSAMTDCLSGSAPFKSYLTILLLWYDQNSNCLLTHTSRPLCNVRPTSYLMRVLRHLWEYHPQLKGCSSLTEQFIPSTKAYKVQFFILKGFPFNILDRSTYNYDTYQVRKSLIKVMIFLKIIEMHICNPTIIYLIQLTTSTFEKSSGQPDK